MMGMKVCQKESGGRLKKEPTSLSKSDKGPTWVFEDAGSVGSFLDVGLDAVKPPPDGVATVKPKK